jgi:hypothetical protein
MFFGFAYHMLPDLITDPSVHRSELLDGAVPPQRLKHPLLLAEYTLDVLVERGPSLGFAACPDFWRVLFRIL